MLPSTLDYDSQTTLSHSSHSMVHRAQAQDGSSVILKMVRGAMATPERVAWLRWEYEICRELDLDCVVQPVALHVDNTGAVLVLEDIGATALSVAVETGPLPVQLALQVGVELARALASVHAAGVTHGDLTPGNVVIARSGQTTRVQLIDFGQASHLQTERSGFSDASSRQGTLAYLSPEQTGRMNRVVDQRSDLYALGATLYHVFTGQPPFTADDALGYVHAHLAQTPARADSVNPDVPAVVASILARLLQKNADDRYPSANSVAADLAACLEQYRETGSCLPFPLDERHTERKFRMPTGLYGRASQTAALLSAYERCVGGAVGLTLVSGHSGTGKSALVREIHAPVTRSRGYFIAGKFDQLNRDTPYGAVLETLRSLLMQVAGVVDVAVLARSLNEALAPNAGVLVEVLPELEQLIGPQPPVPEVAPAEARVRFQMLLTRFIGHFATRAHPLVLFLDDMQWVDAGSLRLLESLLLDDAQRHLLVVGAYREDEVGDGHPLRVALTRLTHASVQTIRLQPLSHLDTRALIADSLGEEPESVDALAALVQAKTSGNPFFLREFLIRLVQDDLVIPEEHGWTWDVEAIEARGITDNVVTLMVDKLERFTDEERALLTAAGALGTEFSMSELCRVTGREPPDVADGLWQALVHGVVLSSGGSYRIAHTPEGRDVDVSYKFSHDRVREAAYSLIPEHELAQVHWRIGRALQHAPTADLFDVVHHLHLGRTLAQTSDQVLELARLHEQAAKKAKASAAFAAAATFAVNGLSSLGENAWTEHYALSLGLANLGAETAFLSGDYESMTRMLAAVDRHATATLDRHLAVEVRTYHRNAVGDPKGAIDVALAFLGQLGIDIPPVPTAEQVGEELQATMALLADRSPGELASAPDATDPVPVTAVRLISTIYSSAYVAAPSLFPVIVLRQLQLIVNHGNTSASPLVYAVYGLLLAGLTDDVAAGHAYGSLGSALLSRPDAAPRLAQGMHLFNCHTRFWCEHVAESAAGEARAFQVGIDTGELEYACYGAHVSTKYDFMRGAPLPSLVPRADQYGRAMIKYKQDLPHRAHRPWHQAMHNLLDGGDTPWVLAGPLYDHATDRAEAEAANDRMALSNAALSRLMLRVIFRRPAEAIEASSEARGLLDAVLSQFDVPTFFFYDALATLITDALGTTDDNLARLQRWAVHAPMNQAHRVALIEAEHHRLNGDVAGARERYDDAIELARTHGFVVEEALAAELASHFYRNAGRAGPAVHYLRDAHAAYARWGAAAKARQLEHQHPTELAGQLTQPHDIAMTTSALGELVTLDLSALMRAAETFASHTVVAELLTDLVRLVLQVAGAERALLLNSPDLHVEAEASTDSVHLGEGRDTAFLVSAARASQHTGRPVLIDDTTAVPELATDAYVASRAVRSVHCLPLTRGQEVRGVLYLESPLVGVFSAERTELLRLLSGQIAIALDNARSHENLEALVQQRTHQLAEATQHAEQASSAKTTFLRSVSHEFRTPLNAILGYAQLLLDGGDLHDKQLEGIQTIQRSGRHLLDLINDILDMSKIEEGRFELELGPMRLDETLSRIADFFRPAAASKSLALEVHTDAALPEWIEADARRFRQIVLNLVSNAVKFTSEGEVSLRAVSDPGGMKLSVRDTGPGIAAEDLGSIFDPFEQAGAAAQRAKGTGLGLAIARKIAREMGGDLSVESAPGRGSTFTLFVPAVACAAGEGPSEPLAAKMLADAGLPPLGDVTVPDVEELRALEAMLGEGAISEIERRAAELCEADPALTDWASRMATMARDFDDEGLGLLLQAARQMASD